MITIFENKATKEAKLHMRNLVTLAKSDGKIAKSELECVYKIGQEKGLSREQIKSIVRKEGEVEVFIPETLKAKFEQLYDLVQVMVADGKIEEREMIFCEEIAGKLGFRPVTKGLLITKMAQLMMDGKKKGLIFRECEPFMV